MEESIKAADEAGIAMGFTGSVILNIRGDSEGLRNPY